MSSKLWLDTMMYVCHSSPLIVDAPNSGRRLLIQDKILHFNLVDQWLLYNPLWIEFWGRRVEIPHSPIVLWNTYYSNNICLVFI